MLYIPRWFINNRCTCLTSSHLIIHTRDKVNRTLIWNMKKKQACSLKKKKLLNLLFFQTVVIHVFKSNHPHIICINCCYYGRRHFWLHHFFQYQQLLINVNTLVLVGPSNYHKLFVSSTLTTLIGEDRHNTWSQIQAHSIG